MAVYDFRCEACGAEFEVERPLGASGKVRCRKCASMRTLKVFGATGIVFRGSGFYVTDSKSGSTAGGGNAPSSAEPKSSEPMPSASDSSVGATPVTDATKPAATDSAPATGKAKKPAD
jgi:putative FmdB family regulatory protein